MPETRVIAGDCTAVYDEGTDRTEHRGRVVALVKPDNTVLVHDADGYQPVAWLTRAESVAVGGEYAVRAHDGDRHLRVAVHDEHTYAAVPTSAAGPPVGPCPTADCPGTLVRAKGSVACPDCGRDHGLPRDAVVRETRCDCGLPRLRVERGAAVDVCLDRDCEPLEEAVRERLDGEYDCPNCGADMRVLRRGGLLFECDRHPDCPTAHSIPSGVAVADCACGLPVFETATGRRCLDADCGQSHLDGGADGDHDHDDEFRVPVPEA